jgi:hypothetical protein
VIGNPKRLEDLEKIDAGVKITCGACKRERLVSRDRLIRDLVARGHSTSWEMLPGRLRCVCGSKKISVLAMPFTSGEEDGEMLFERLLRAFEHLQKNPHRQGNADWCRHASDCAAELHQATVAMRAWIVARDARTGSKV